MTEEVITPADEASLAEAVSTAATARTPLEIEGGGTRRGLGRPVQASATLSTRGLSGITTYEPGALTLIAQAGTPIAEIEAALAAEGQMLPFEPIDHRALLRTDGAPTIGGAVAVAASGPRRLQKGACRDFMLGVRFVDGEGQVIKNGGRVMKNVTGYDLVKLMAGQYGTLGVLTEIAFKVLPAPQATVTLTARDLPDRAAVEALSRALGSPYDVAGAAHLDASTAGGTAETYLRIEGLTRSAAYRTGKLLEVLGAGWDVAPDPTAPWQAIRDVVPFADREGAVWRVSVKPTDGPALVENLLTAGLDVAALYDWGGGLVWLLAPEDGDAGARTIRDQTAALGGHATLIRATAATRAAVDVFEPEPPVVARLSAGLRAKFDPHGILNPGRMAVV